MSLKAQTMARSSVSIVEYLVSVSHKVREAEPIVTYLLVCPCERTAAMTKALALLVGRNGSLKSE